MAIGLKNGDIEVITQTAIFGGLTAENLDRLLEDAVVRSVGRGETLFLQGDPADAFYVMLEGWVKIYRMTPAGEEAVVGVFTRGQSFAEAAAFTKGAFPASGEAVTDSRVLIVAARHLFERITESPEIGLSMLASTSVHLHMLVRQIEQLKAHTGAQRVAEFLLQLCSTPRGACTIELPYDKALIAGRLGMKPESLSRAFQRLKEFGVKIDQNKAAIRDIGALRDFVDAFQRFDGFERI
ncbi:MAG TPA: Crp/Fnr family transcriptional regulator, partial [Hyphomicrobiales bacterium]|nr:Crp/Fnr family transcriptional regulator [Hyphomicrobiales bacterium]